MSDIPVCVKTPKGIIEVEQRACRLPMRSRQVLIMIDGKRDQAALSAMFPGDALPGILASLIEDGFITPLVKEAPPPAPQAEEDAAEQAPVRPAVPAPANEHERYIMARNFMLNTVSAFVGISASSLTSRIETAQSIDELRHNFDEWRNAIQLSREGRKQLPDLEARLAALLS